MRTHGRAPARANGRAAEAGFSLVELIVVLVIVAILVAVISPQIANTRQKTGAPQTNLAAGAIWRGVQNYRLENGGSFPPIGMLQAPATFVNPGGGRYVQRWPEDTRGRPMPVQQGTGTASSPSPVVRGGVVYRQAGMTGWLVAFSENGNIIYRREVGNSGAVPAG